jgi:hypothetical protein
VATFTSAGPAVLPTTMRQILRESAGPISSKTVAFSYLRFLANASLLPLIGQALTLLCRRRDHQLFGRNPGFVTLPGRTRLARQQTKRGPRESDLLVRGFA